MQFKITLHCPSPKIYLVETEDEKHYIAHSVFKKFALILGENFERDLDLILLEQKTYLMNLSREYLSLAEKSTFHLVRFLSRHECSPSLKEEIIRKMREENFLNDERYLNLFLENALQRGLSFRAVKEELKRKKIALDMEKIFYDEPKSLENLIKTNSSLLRKEKKKLSEYLLRRGFLYQNIKKLFLGMQGED